jgi:hypothetical protein
LGELCLHFSTLIQIHGPIQADNREPMIIEKLLEHFLRRHKLSKDQELEIRIVLSALILVEDLKQRLSTSIRPLGLAATSKIEKQRDLFLFVLQTSQSPGKQLVELLLAIAIIH